VTVDDTLLDLVADGRDGLEVGVDGRHPVHRRAEEPGAKDADAQEDCLRRSHDRPVKRWRIKHA
jgi:hypothetical protein